MIRDANHEEMPFMNPLPSFSPVALASTVEEYLDELALAELRSFRQPALRRLIRRCCGLLAGVTSGLLAIFSIRGGAR
jgi:hypothetical protein